MKPLLSSRPKGRHRRVEPKTRGNAAAVVAVAVVGGTAISASATSSAPAPSAPSTEADQATADHTQSQSTSTPTVDAHRAARIRAERAAAQAKHRAAERAKQAAARAARAKLAAEHRWVAPMKSSYQFTSEFGPRWGHLHAGIDLAAPVGSPVAAMSSGVVTFAGQKNGYGNALVIEYWDGTKSLYGHLQSMNVSYGQRITPGQMVALSGNTGHSTGPHLHLEIRPKDSAANTMSRMGKRVSRHVDTLTVMASNDVMARAGVEPAPVDPVPWMRERRIAPQGAH